MNNQVALETTEGEVVHMCMYVVFLPHTNSKMHLLLNDYAEEFGTDSY